MTISNVITGISLGMTILLGQKIGEKKLEDAGKIIGSGIVLFFILALITSVLMIFTTTAWIKMLRVPVEAIAPCKSYMIICSAGIVFIVAYNLLGAIFRGLGNSKLPLIIVAIASVFNIFGDLFFVAVLKMGSAGAAIATVMAQALSVVISLFIIVRMDLPFTFNIKMIKFSGNCNAQILRLGVPVAFQDLLVSISFFVLTAIVNSMGVIASAGIGTSLLVSVFIAYLGFFHGNLLCGFFSKENAVVFAGWEYLKGYSIDVLFTSFLFCFIGFYNGAGRTKFVMLQGIFGAFCIRVPLSFIINHFYPDSIFYLSLATPSSTVMQIVICFVYASFFFKKENMISNPKTAEEKLPE